MICCRDTHTSPWICVEDDGTPIPPSDPRVASFAAEYDAARSALSAPLPPRLHITPVEVNARMRACAACEHRRLDTDRCALMSCGCALTSRQQSLYAICPADHWPLLPPRNP